MDRSLKVGFCVSGRGRLFLQAIRHRDELGIEPAFLATGRTADPVLREVCRRSEIPHLEVGATRAERDQTIARLIDETGAGLVVLTFDHVLGPDVVARHPGRIINVHPGLLPAFAGPRAIERASASGARFAGATVHVVTDDVDGGPIIAQCVVPIMPGEPADALRSSLGPPLIAMYLQVLRWYVEGRVMSDVRGGVIVTNARYDTLPISPAVERSFAE